MNAQTIKEARGPSLDAETLRREVAKLRWFHRIDLGQGIVTPGQIESGPTLKLICMPESLAGLSVLDIGAWSGLYSFEAERRGARRVLATDSVAWDSQEWGKGGFDLAKRALNSKVEEMRIDVMDLSPERVGTFDVVFFLGVLYHLRHPLLALERVLSVTKGYAIVETAVDKVWDRRPSAVFYPGTELNNDDSNWWGPNPPAVEAMLKAAGFSRVERKGVDPSPFWRVYNAASLSVRGRCKFLSQVQQARAAFHAWR